MAKNKREQIAQGKRQVEEKEAESESEEDSEPMEAQHDQAEESDQEAEPDQEEEAEGEEDAEIEEVQPVRRRTRSTRAAQNTRAPLLRPDPNQLLMILKSMEFTGTRYPHQDTMRELGIKRDVDYLLEMCDLAMMASQRCEAYKEETCQFLSSFVLHFYEDEPEVASDGGLGYITFTVNGEQYGLTTNQLDTLYGFPSGQGRKREFDKNELRSLWKTIGDKKVYTSKSSKSAQIRSPVIRYLHKSIAHTFFARKSTGNVNEGELQFLDTAIGHVRDFTTEGVPLQGDTSDTGPTMTLLDQFSYYRGWATKLFNKQKKGELSIGGLVTPILVACGIDLHGKAYKPKWIDIPYLIKTGFLEREKIEGCFAYKFTHPLPNIEALFLLPNEEHTGIKHRQSQQRRDVIQEGPGVDFCPPLQICYDASHMPQPLGQNRASDEEDEDEEAISYDQIDFEEYTATRERAGVKAAHKNIGFLKKLSKYQGKAIKSLMNTVSDLKQQVKDLQRKVTGSSSKSTKKKSTKPVMERSRSMVQEVRRPDIIEPPRASSFEPRETRASKRQAKEAQQRHQNIESGSGEGQSSRRRTRQHSQPAYTRESMEETVHSFFTNP